eukprot:m.344130 g.344130  ORF g.344130 m.344130 type:complete len:740 (+) comp23876_c0_seq1:75-2294(+)
MKPSHAMRVLLLLAMQTIGHSTPAFQDSQDEEQTMTSSFRAPAESETETLTQTFQLNRKLREENLVPDFMQEDTEEPVRPCAIDDDMTPEEAAIDDGVPSLEPDPLARIAFQHYEFPIVFYVIHDGNKHKPPLSILEDQLDVMNQAFSNGHGNCPPGKGDTGIQFKIHDVQYVDNADWTKNCLNRQTAIRNAHWMDSKKYINIYVCQMGSYLGLAKYPWAHSEGSRSQSMFISTRSLPGFQPQYESCDYSCRYNEGKTCVHEMGHYLGLYHTFNQNKCSASSSDGDKVSDTPPQSKAGTGCSSDSCTFDNLDDPNWSYMDYSNDNCMTCFSPGQTTRMRSMIERYRSNLVTNSMPCGLVTCGSGLKWDGECNGACVTCPQGQYKIGSDSRVECDTHEVTSCPPGQYMNNRLSTTSMQECRNCPTGTYKSGTSNADIFSCLPHPVSECGPGFRMENKGSSTEAQECVGCASGTYKSGTDSSTSCLQHSVTLCDPGAYLANFGSTVTAQTCTPCPSGTYKTGTNADTSCLLETVTECGPGTYLINVGDSTRAQRCTSCDDGSYKTGTNAATSCVAHTVQSCSPGKYLANKLSKDAAQTCQECPDGTYQEEESSNATSCDVHSVAECGPNYFLQNKDSKIIAQACEPCPTGTVKNGTNSITTCVNHTTSQSVSNDSSPCTLAMVLNMTDISCESCNSNSTGIAVRSGLCSACMEVFRTGNEAEDMGICYMMRGRRNTGYRIL